MARPCTTSGTSSSDNIARATEAALRAGVADRVTFQSAILYDFDGQAMHNEWPQFLDRTATPCDWLFVGEFVEHVADCAVLVDALETALTPGAVVVYTCPSGPFV